jgi:hypothetical protein
MSMLTRIRLSNSRLQALVDKISKLTEDDIQEIKQARFRKRALSEVTYDRTSSSESGPDDSD